jgi:pyruvate,water dikinase
VVTGTARRIGSPSELDRLQRGDVLVTTSTTESFNIVLPILSAIVTDAGGLLSHAAIVSREYGIPAVVGCRDATALIADGARVRVDGNVGEVTVLAP